MHGHLNVKFFSTSYRKTVDRPDMIFMLPSCCFLTCYIFSIPSLPFIIFTGSYIVFFFPSSTYTILSIAPQIYVRLLYPEAECITLLQWRTQGGFGCSHPPPEIPKALQNVPNSTRLWKLLKKLMNLGRQHAKMFGKKDSKILKRRRFAIVLH